MGIFRAYQAWFERLVTPRLGQQRAHREGPVAAVLLFAIVLLAALTAVASLARDAGALVLAIVLYLLAIAMLPCIIVAWRRLDAARRPR